MSSKDQSTHSLGNQADNIRLYCEANGRYLIGTFEDDGHSAKTFDRPDWKKLEVFLTAHHKEIDLLLVDTFDRFSRNLTEALEMIGKLERKYSLTVVSVTEPIAVHPDHPDYFTQRAKYFLDAHSERLRIRFRTGRGVWKANKEGRHLGHAPWGYKKENGFLVPDPKNAPHVVEAFRMFLAGAEKTNILAYLRGKGYPKSGKVAINRMLENPVYSGLIRVKAFYGQDAHLVKGRHIGIITEANFYRAQDLLNAKTFTRLVLNDEVPLRGVLLCHCGKKLTAGNSKGKKLYVWYYKCSEHKTVNINAKRIHAQLNDIMAGLSLPELYIDEIRRKLNDRLNAIAGTQQEETAQKQKQITDLEKKIEGLEQKYIEEDLDKDTYRKWHDRYTKERVLLAAEIEEAKIPVNETFAKVEQHMARLTNMSYLYDKANTPQKQSLISWVFNSQLYWADGSYRTPSVQPLFAANVMRMNEKGLIRLDQPSKENRVLNAGSQNGASIEPLLNLLTLVSEITAA